MPGLDSIVPVAVIADVKAGVRVDLSFGKNMVGAVGKDDCHDFCTGEGLDHLQRRQDHDQEHNTMV